MAQERLPSISLLNIDKDFEINAEQILTDFIAKKNDFLKQNIFMIFNLLFNRHFFDYLLYSNSKKK